MLEVQAAMVRVVQVTKVVQVVKVHQKISIDQTTIDSKTSIKDLGKTNSNGSSIKNEKPKKLFNLTTEQESV
ncbi:MAG: hypothetical protein EOM05_07680 [Clostridia bacterium]|nr:hypothetical protein [Clostridia bacterium]